MFEVILSKTVIIAAIVAEEDVAVLAIPHRLVSLLFVVVAMVATSTVPYSSDGVVGLAKTRGVTRTAWSLSTGIAPPSPGQLETPSRTCMAGQ